MKDIAKAQGVELPAAKQRLRRGRMMLVTALAAGGERRAALRGVPLRCWEARGRVSPGAFAFCACGADDEITVAENAAAWRALRLRPRVLRDVRSVDTSLTLLGAPARMPIMLAPTKARPVTVSLT